MRLAAGCPHLLDAECRPEVRPWGSPHQGPGHRLDAVRRRPRQSPQLDHVRRVAVMRSSCDVHEGATMQKAAMRPTLCHLFTLDTEHSDVPSSGWDTDGALFSHASPTTSAIARRRIGVAPDASRRLLAPDTKFLRPPPRRTSATLLTEPSQWQSPVGRQKPGRAAPSPRPPVQRSSHAECRKSRCPASRDRCICNAARRSTVSRVEAGASLS